MRILPYLPLVALWSATAFSQSLELASPFQNEAVLQRDRTVAVWGWATPGSEVTLRASWMDALLRTRTRVDGTFRFDLSTPGARLGQTLEVASGNDTITLQDVAVGEVWLCSGQSNMEWRMSQVGPDYEHDADDLELQDLRYFQVPNEIDVSPRTRCKGHWETATPERVRAWSAVATYFGRRLRDRLGVPVGLIDADWGGTVVEAWTSEEALRAIGEFEEELDRIDRRRSDPAAFEREDQERGRAWWTRLADRDEGSAEGRFARADWDDTSWATMTVPGPWPDDLQRFDGVVWLRRAFALRSLTGATKAMLELGPIDDMDTVWINGVRVGGIEVPGRWQEPRRYDVPLDALRAGDNVIAVRVVDTGGGGGTNDPKAKLRLTVESKAAYAPRADLDGTWRYRVGASMRDLGSYPSTSSSFHANTPTALWNGMVAPLVPYGIRGAIWYQGESNRDRAFQYRRLFPAMIRDWRARFENEGFPFYYVQIAPFQYGGDQGEAAELREAQFLTLLLENTGMAVTMDIGNPRDIHPRNKRDVGDRLARWAFARTYGMTDVVASGPLYRAMTIEGSSIRLHFDHVDGGLAPVNVPLSCFRIAGEDRVFHDAEARIDGGTVIVRAEAVPTPGAVRFAWGAADQPNLRNAAGLPASSFRTDAWPGLTEAR